MLNAQIATTEPPRAPARRQALPIKPYVLRGIHLLDVSGGYIAIADLADRLEMNEASIRPLIGAARNALDAIGATITLEGPEHRRGYRLNIPNREMFDRLMGPRPESIGREHAPFRGFILIKATVLRLIVEANGKEVPAGTLAQSIYGSRSTEVQHRIYNAVHRIRDALRMQGESYTIGCRGLPAERAYVLEHVAPATPATVPDPRLDRAGRIRGITLPTCGYEAWNYRPPTNLRGAVHIVRARGEEHDRVLTEIARSQGITTDKAAHRTLPFDEGGEDGGEA